MKFLHLGDLHLGKSLGEYSLIDDQKYILERVLDRIRLLKAQGDDAALLIAGDVFDKSIPSEQAVNLFDWFLRELAAENVSTFVISGNHDSDERLNFGSSFFTLSRIYISSVFDGTLKKYPLRDAFGEIDVWLLPFVKASQVRHYYPEEKIDTYEDAVRVILEHAGLDTGRRNLLVAHQFVTGKGKASRPGHGKGSDTGAGTCSDAGRADNGPGTLKDAQGAPRLAGSEGVMAQTAGLVEMIGAEIFDAFDYVALGHIHTCQGVGRDTVRYAGSPLKYSLAEAHADKYMPLVTMGRKGQTDVELLPLRPRRNLRHIRGRMKDLLNPENVTDTDDFIYATLTDVDEIPDVMAVFRASYPNMVRIDYDNAHTRQTLQAEALTQQQIRPFSEMIGDFYVRMYGCEMSEEERRIMIQIAGKAGVANEAD